MSGLRINLQKSCLISVGLGSLEVQHIVCTLGCQSGSLPMKYLGLQLGARRRDTQRWNRVVGLVRSRLESWKSRYLLMGGRLVLIHLVLSSLPVYQMSGSVLPEGVRRKLHRMLSHFGVGVR